MTTKRPAFQFYPADWRKDVELQSCSMAAQGLWINTMCIAHECEPYGQLTINGKGMTPAQLGRQVGLSARECDALLTELHDAGVAKKTPEGVFYSKRMVEDEALRNLRAAGGVGGAEHGVKGGSHGSKGGRPKKDKGGFETPLEPFDKPPPSSSSSSSSSSTSTSVDVARTPGEACKAMKQAGLQSVNPSNPKLIALLAAGITIAELVDAASHAMQNQKPFAYALATAEGRRRDAATAPLPEARASPDETNYQRSMRLRMEEFAPEIARKAPGQPQNPVDFFRTVDVQTLEIAK